MVLFLSFSFSFYFFSLIYCCAKSMGGGLREAVAGIEIFGSATLVDREVGICTLMLVDILGPSASMNEEFLRLRKISEECSNRSRMY